MSENEMENEGSKVLRLKSKKDKKEEPRKVVAYLDDYELTIPEKFSAAFALRYVRMTSRYGVDASTDWMLENALGAEGYEKLLGFDDMEPEQLAVLVNVIQESIIGAMEVPKERLKSV